MKCPNCRVEMQKGWSGEGWWRPGEMIKIFPKLVGNFEFMVAWRCPECGKVELYTEVKNK